MRARRSRVLPLTFPLAQLLGLLLVPLVVPGGRAGAQAACTYDACALRVEGTRIVRGRAGAPVGRLGPLSASPLAPLVAGSDSAGFHARRFDATYRRAMIRTQLGGLLAAAPVVVYAAAHGNPRVGWLAAAIPGLVVQTLGVRELGTARSALARAIWWYDRDLPR